MSTYNEHLYKTKTFFLNGHLFTTDISVRQTPLTGEHHLWAASYQRADTSKRLTPLPHRNILRIDTSLWKTIGASPEHVSFRGSPPFTI